MFIYETRLIFLIIKRVYNMKKGVLFVMILLLVGLVYGLTTIETLSPTLIDFSLDRDVNVTVDLPGNANVLSATMSLEGLLSDWETVDFYNSTLNQPVDAEYLHGGNDWLVADIGNDNIKLIDMTTKLVTTVCSFNDPYDIDEVGGTNWLVAARGDNQVVLIDNSCTVLNSYNVTSPESVEFVNDSFWLVSSSGIDLAILVDVSGGHDVYPNNVVSNYSVNDPNDIEFVSFDNTLLIARNNQIIKVNFPSMTLNRIEPISGNILSVESVDNDEKWLYINQDNKEVILLNTSNSAVLNYFNSSLSNPKDAKYISENEWFITDEAGTKKVAIETKFYPKNPTIDVKQDGDFEWGYHGEFNTTDVFNYQNFTDELNEILDTLDDDNTTYQVPLLFHSDTSGIINITAVNVVYNQKPNVTVNFSNGGDYLADTEALSWVTADDDGDSLFVELYFYNVSGWESLTSGYNLSTYNWDTQPVVNGDYVILVNVTDGINRAEDTSDANFTIDNTFPTADITMGDTFFRKDGVVITANASDNYDVNRVNATIVCPSNTTSDIVLTNTSANVFTTTWLSDVTTDIGVCTVTVDVEDMAGNVNTTTKVITLKLSMDIYLELSDANPTQNTDITAYGYVYYDNGTADARLVNVTFIGTDYNTTSNGSGYYASTVRASADGIVYADIYEDGETFSNSSSLTVKTFGGGGGGGGGGTTADCGDGICQINRETCSSCTIDCGVCQPTGIVSLVVPDRSLDNATVTPGDESELQGSGTDGNSGILEQVPGGEVLEPQGYEDNLVSGLGFGVFTDFLKKPTSILLFAALVAVIVILWLTGWRKKKKSDFLREFGD